jgi:hypothetical protein
LPVQIDDPRGGRRSNADRHESGGPPNRAPRRRPEPRAPGGAPPREPGTRTLKAGQPRSWWRSRKRRVTVVHAVAVASAFVVLAALGTSAYYRLGPGRPDGDGAAAAFNALPNSKALAVLNEERQQIAAMNAAVDVVSKTSKVSGVSPASVVSAANASAEQATEEETVASGELSPSAAMEVAQELMPEYGFSVAGQWSCLYDIWERESGWEWDAENPASGAYGIAQSYPADKMASVAADYMTDATTQIKWGLGYIEDTYGTPCEAWNVDITEGGY